MTSNFSSISRFIVLILLVGAFALDISAQAAKDSGDGPGGWLWVGVIAIAGLGAGYFFWRKSQKGDHQPKSDYENRYSNYYNGDSDDSKGVDADKEMEWLRKAKRSTVKSPKEANPLNGKVSIAPQKRDASYPQIPKGVKPMSINEFNFDTKAFQEKMRKLQYSQMPINSFSELKPSKIYEPLPLSNDPSVLNAIEQANDEFEEDESVRELAVRVLTAFRTRNSVESLTQIALYDLSSNLRSKAVATLTDFDHESVFESILLACADPTREVRAAAARGLFRLNFDRADAWKRIIETNDPFRMRHAARAAIESGIVVKSFDRLVHEDLKVAYESFVLVSLMVKSGETIEICEAIKNHKDERIKFALLHVIKEQKDERALAALQELRQNNSFPPDVADRIRDTVDSFTLVMA